MKIVIANNMVPFLWGGAEELAANLAKRIRGRGHEVELLRLPFKWEPFSCLPLEMLVARSLEVTNADHLIALKFPAYLIPHVSKTLWLLHQYRQAYDLFESEYSNLPATPEGADVRSLIREADNLAFRESKKIFTNSEVTSDRLLRYNGFASIALHPPLNDAELFTGGESRGYIFAGGRINGMKRQELLVRALAKTPSNVRLIVAGPAESESDGENLLQLAEKLDVSDRLELLIGFHSREKIADLVNHSIACAYIPFDEDSLGYVSMEAVEAGKPVITTSDSGGVQRLVRDGSSGWVVAPDADALALAMSRAVSSATRSRAMGKAARHEWRDMKITWDDTLDRLVP